MSGKRYTIRLTTEEREQLNRLVRGGKHAARIVTRARILIKIDEGWTVPQIAAAPVSSTRQALNIHRMASLYETFPAAEARRIVKRLEYHHTPKHASWLNMAEIEFSVLTRDCLRGRHGDDVALAGAIDAYETRRNIAKATIDWRFSTQDARTKLHRLYPCNS